MRKFGPLVQEGHQPSEAKQVQQRPPGCSGSGPCGRAEGVGLCEPGDGMADPAEYMSTA